MHDFYLGVCALVEQTNYMPNFLGLVVCNGDEIGPCLKPYQLKILCENSIRSKKKRGEGAFRSHFWYCWKVFKSIGFHRGDFVNFKPKVYRYWIFNIFFHWNFN